LCAAFLTLAHTALDRDLHESKDRKSDRSKSDEQLPDRYAAEYVDV
jgi:hypothetical protein